MKIYLRNIDSEKLCTDFFTNTPFLARHVLFENENGQPVSKESALVRNWDFSSGFHIPGHIRSREALSKWITDEAGFKRASDIYRKIYSKYGTNLLVQEPPKQARFTYE